VLRLDKPIGAPVDLYLKDVKLATATVVVIDDRFAVRIEEILGPGPRGAATAADA
jgi:flagellar motor switch/type III secretory pathway protein FliN